MAVSPCPLAAQARPAPWSPAGAAAPVFSMARRIESIPPDYRQGGGARSAQVPDDVRLLSGGGAVKLSSPKSALRAATQVPARVPPALNVVACAIGGRRRPGGKVKVTAALTAAL